MDQDETWHAGKPRPWPHCVKWGPSSPFPKGAQPPIFVPYLLWPNGWMDQDETWHGLRPRPWSHCVRWGPSSLLPQKGHSSPPPPNFRPMYAVAKRLDGLRCHLVGIGRPRPRRPCVRSGPSSYPGYPPPSPKGAQQPSLFGQCLLWPNG